MTPHPDHKELPAEQDPEGSGPPYRAIAMVLLTLVVVAVGIGLVQLLGGDDSGESTKAASTSSSAPVSPAAPPAGANPAPGAPAPTGPDGQPVQVPPQDPAGQPAPGAPVVPPAPAGQGATGQAAAASDRAAAVRILNNSTVTGLAGRTGDRLKGDGFRVSGVTNFPSSEGVVPVSVVYYGAGAGEQATAEAVAATLGIRAEPRPSGFVEPRPGVDLIVTQDLQR